MKHSQTMQSGTAWQCTAVLFAVLGGCSDGSQNNSQSRTSDSATPQIATSIDDEALLSALRAELQTDPSSVQRALLDKQYTSLRDTRAFREAIRDAVVEHTISELTLAPPDEPGRWLEIEGQVVDQDENPIPGAVVNVFGTDKNGYYHPTIAGESTPRLFGVLVTDSKGTFRFRTIRPGPYPGTRNAEHFHIWASAPGKRMVAPQYAVFDDDPLLQLPENAEQRGEAIRIKMNKPDETGVAHGTVVLPLR